jgi:hypothetical protein
MASKRRLNALQQLIHQHMETTGENFTDIATRGGLPRQTVSALMTRTTYSSIPHQRTLDRLAKGLQVSKATVRNAAAASMTIGNGRTADTPAAVLLMDLAEKLPEWQVRVLIGTARTMARETPAPEMLAHSG